METIQPSGNSVLAATASTGSETSEAPVAVKGAPRRPRELESVQIFRGWAALLVVLSHASTFTQTVFGQPFLHGAFSFGNAGVDFFFVLSGFIIFYVHGSDLGQPVRLRPFAIKRLLRIYPIFWVACAVIIPIYFANGNPLTRDPVAILTTFLLIPQDHWPVLPVAWTLTHEMLFYTGFGLLIWRFRWAIWPVALWVCGAIACYVALLVAPRDARAIDSLLAFPWKWLFHPHNLEFLLGCGAAYCLRRFPLEKTRYLHWVGALLFILCAITDQPGSSWKAVAIVGQPLSYGLASTLLVLGASAQNLTGKKLPLPAYRFWHYLGDASYSVYLFHSVGLSLTFRFGRNLVDHHLLTPALAAAGAIALAVSLGCLAHSFLEKPLLRVLRRRFLVNPHRAE